jgi:hypothetical protein
MDPRRIAAGWDRLFAALGVREQADTRRRVVQATTDDGRIRLDRPAMVLDPAFVDALSATQVAVDPGSSSTNVQEQLDELESLLVDAITDALDSTSIDFTITDHVVTGVVIYGGSGGDFGSAATVARSDHLHAATYSPLGHTHTSLAWSEWLYASDGTLVLDGSGIVLTTPVTLTVTVS